MASDIVVMLAVPVAGPLVTLVHELGHATVALRFADRPVYIQVGGRTAARSFTHGRLSGSVSPLAAGGFCRSTVAGFTRPQLVTHALGGCAANLAFGALLGLIALSSSGWIRAVLLAVAALNAFELHNLIARHSSIALTRGLPSDGLTAWCLLRARPIPPAPRNPARAGLRDPVTRAQAVNMLLGVLLGVLWLGEVASHAWLSGLLVLGLIHTAAGHLEEKASDDLGQRPSPAALAPPPTQRCPRCAAEVTHRAKTCFCLHHFP